MSSTSLSDQSIERGVFVQLTFFFFRLEPLFDAHPARISLDHVDSILESRSELDGIRRRRLRDLEHLTPPPLKAEAHLGRRTRQLQAQRRRIERESRELLEVEIEDDEEAVRLGGDVRGGDHRRLLEGERRGGGGDELSGARRTERGEAAVVRLVLRDGGELLEGAAVARVHGDENLFFWGGGGCF